MKKNVSTPPPTNSVVSKPLLLFNPRILYHICKVPYAWKIEVWILFSLQCCRKVWELTRFWLFKCNESPPDKVSSRMHCICCWFLNEQGSWPPFRNSILTRTKKLANRLTDWLTNWCPDCLADWLTDWLTDAGTDRWLPTCLTEWLTNQLTFCLPRWLTDWKTDWPPVCLRAPLTDWRMDRLTDYLPARLNDWQADLWWTD